MQSQNKDKKHLEAAVTALVTAEDCLRKVGGPKEGGAGTPPTTDEHRQSHDLADEVQDVRIRAQVLLLA